MGPGTPWSAWHCLFAFCLPGQAELTCCTTSLIQGQKLMPLFCLGFPNTSLWVNVMWCLLFSRTMLAQHLSILFVKAMGSGVTPNWHANVRASSNWSSLCLSKGIGRTAPQHFNAWIELLKGIHSWWGLSSPTTDLVSGHLNCQDSVQRKGQWDQ